VVPIFTSRRHRHADQIALGEIALQRSEPIPDDLSSSLQRRPSGLGYGSTRSWKTQVPAPLRRRQVDIRVKIGPLLINAAGLRLSAQSRATTSGWRRIRFAASSVGKPIARSSFRLGVEIDRPRSGPAPSKANRRLRCSAICSFIASSSPSFTARRRRHCAGRRVFLAHSQNAAKTGWRFLCRVFTAFAAGSRLAGVPVHTGVSTCRLTLALRPLLNAIGLSCRSSQRLCPACVEASGSSSQSHTNLSRPHSANPFVDRSTRRTSFASSPAPSAVVQPVPSRRSSGTPSPCTRHEAETGSLARPHHRRWT
jgi:hypothetical protein